MPDMILPPLTTPPPARTATVRDEAALLHLSAAAAREAPAAPWFARLVAAALAEAPRPLTEALGLDRASVNALFARFFPSATTLITGADAGEEEIEEADLRGIFLAHARDPADPATLWVAAIVTRRSLRPNHLWQDLGMDGRGQMIDLLNNYFPALVARNDKDMKWKKFLYRLMCEGEGFIVCKSPVCESCSDFDLCFDGED